MREVLLAKAHYCSEYRERLSQTKENTLHENTSHTFWGGNNGGLDKLGLLHMEIRRQMEEGHIKVESDEQPKKKPSVVILGDSNTKRIDPEKMTKKFNIQVVDTKTTQAASNAIKSLQQIRNSDIIIFHTGTNDLHTHGAEHTAERISHMTNFLVSKGKKVILSKLLPREGNLNKLAHETNKILERKFRPNKDVCTTNINAFLQGHEPNPTLYYAPYSSGKKLPLLHLNSAGVRELSRQIQWSLKQTAKTH